MTTFKGIRAIVTDIEGTTSSISFVHDVLFPYARARIPGYVHNHADDIADILADICKETGSHTMQIDDCIQTLLLWMDEDRKITPLKAIQGMIWEQGYKDGVLKGHVFPDVAGKLAEWKQEGIQIYVYSSGSIAAQKLIFGYSDAGDLTPYFDGYFDTTIGGKKEPSSYMQIVNRIGIPSQNILFLSDHTEELQAAQNAGFSVLGLSRPGNIFDLKSFRCVNSFNDINIEFNNDRTKIRNTP
jgi:enolase-phosphatase E1